jgi:hypothetical protein
MLIPTGSVHTATATATTIKEVKCAFCHRPYFYVMTRSASGRDSAPLFIGQGDAKAKAAADAHRKLVSHLKFDVDPVACPNCGKYQPGMVAAARDLKMSMKKILLISGISFAVAFITAGLTYDEKNPSNIGWLAYLVPIVVFAALAIYRGTSDPNRDASTRIGMSSPGPARFDSRAKAEEAIAGGSPRPAAPPARSL